MSNLEATRSYDFKFKIIAVGDFGCGKSSLLLTHHTGHFDALINGQTDDEHFKELTVRDKKVRIDVLSMSGMERFSNMNSSFYRRVDAALFCISIGKPFDSIDRNQVLENISRWQLEADRYSGLYQMNSSKYLVCTKSDLQYKKAEGIKAPKNIILFPTLLPNESIFSIISSLSPKELNICNRISRSWYSMMANDDLWKRLYFTHVSKKDFPFDRSTWKEEYFITKLNLITLPDVQNLAEKLDMKLFITSAKLGTNVNKVFEEVAEHLVNTKMGENAPTGSSPPKVEPEKKKGFFQKLFKK